jgi:catechol 2,3-dioxygenase-like lactoylglutathione lyase family enzyme
MNWTLEVVVVPVTDVERAKTFYEKGLGFHLDHDSRISDDLRVVQLTPPGSGCSIVIGHGLGNMAPGSLEGLQLVVNDLRAAHATLRERGIDTTDIQVYGKEGLRPLEVGDDLNNVGFIYFSDPDGNRWAVQQITARA